MRSRDILGFSGDGRVRTFQGMATVVLTPEQQRFVDEAVAQGRYRDADEVVRAGLGLLRRAEAERAAFIASLEEAEAESEREGWYSLDEVLAEADRIIASKRDAA